QACAGQLEYTAADLGTLGGPAGVFATAMNNLGEVVGYGDIYTRYSHAFLYPGSGPILNLGSFGGDYSVSIATGVNDAGTIVGYSNSIAPGSSTHAFRYTQSGGMQDLGTLGGDESFALGVNNSGEIIGYSATSIPGGV